MSFSKEELGQRFETDLPFDEQETPEILGRLIWLTVRQRAEYMLFLREQGLGPDLSAKVALGFTCMQRDYLDFVYAGLDPEDVYAAERTEHPYEGILNKLTYQLMGLDEGNLKAIVLGEALEGYDFYADLLRTETTLDDASALGAEDTDLDDDVDPEDFVFVRLSGLPNKDIAEQLAQLPKPGLLEY